MKRGREGCSMAGVGAICMCNGHTDTGRHKRIEGTEQSNEPDPGETRRNEAWYCVSGGGGGWLSGAQQAMRWVDGRIGWVLTEEER